MSARTDGGAPRSVGARRKSRGKMKLAMALEEHPEDELRGATPNGAAASSSNSASNNADAAPELPGPEWKFEPILRNAIHTLLQETVQDDEGFTMLREVCQQTLTHSNRVSARNRSEMILSIHGSGSGFASGSSRNGSRITSLASSSAASETDESASAAKATLMPPKSPQERLMALVPNAIEKGKRTYQRRLSPNISTDEHAGQRKKQDEEMPITDLTVMFTGDTVPDGFSKVSNVAGLPLERSPSGLRADLNKGARGVFVYLCQSKDQSSNKLPISEIIAIYPERGEFVPTDYEVVQRRGLPANLNTGTQGEKILLCYKRSATSSIVNITVLFPKKGEKIPYNYMKLDKSPDGHVADLNMNSGGTEVFLCYKKTPPVQPKHKVAGFHLVSHAHPSTPTATSMTKSIELRNTQPASPPASTLINTCEINDAEVDPTFSWKDAQDYYMYPLLLACYTRHGPAAEAALQGLSQCLDAGIFDETAIVSEACRLEVIVDAVASICHQAVKSRFAQALPFFRKVVRKCPNGFGPAILHAILKSIIFIGDFDSLLVKSVENEFVYNIMSRYESDQCQHELAVNKRAQARVSSWNSNEVARSIVTHLIDDISSGCETAKITERMLGVFKSHSSIHSSAFCTDLIASMSDIAESDAEMNALQLIITLSKAVHRRVANATEHGHDHDQLSIINSLRGLNVALLAAGTQTKERQIFGQIVRRFVFSTVNSIVLIWSTDVFRASLTLVSTLWNHYRRHLKVELALLFEHLILRILRSSAVCAVNHQMDIMQELTPWMQLPHNVVEFFLNFDMDRIHQWSTFEQVCCALCAIAEGTNTHIASTEESKDVALNLQIEAITAMLAIARSVMDASGHAHLISRDARTRHLSMDNGGWEQDETGDESLPSVPTLSTSPTIPVALGVHENPNPTSQPSSPISGKSPMDSSTSNDTRKPKFASMSVRMRNELQERNRQLLLRAKEIASSKSLKKAIEYLVAMNFVKDSPRDVTSFLRMYHDSFDEAEIGDYLGEGDEDFKVQVRLSYVRAISFKGMTLVESLRHFLTNGGFRLPGEAQKIERMVEAFAQCYYEDSPASFSSADTAMIIAYSIIMLNTDLHNPQVKKNKMSKEQFVKNNRGIDNGKDLPKRFLEEIYEDIAHHPMHIKGTRFTPKAREPSSSLIDLESDKFRGNLSRSVAQFEELLKDLSQSYYTFNFVGVDACISPDLIKLLFERIWFQLLTLSATILCNNQSDLTMTTHCLDLLRFSISTCLFLGMPIERQAFCSLLAKVKSTLDENSTGDNEADESQTWMENIEAAAATDDPWRAMGDIHLLIKRMKDMIQRQKTSEELSLVIKRINRSHIYLKDTTRFIREGDLTKKCRSRNQTYRFFLFNDQLLYADKNISGHYWNPHNSLRLKLTRIGDIPDNVMHKHAFQILNPTKSFIVYAESAHAKAEWIRVIEDAIAEAAKKINRNARRLSTHEDNSVDLGAAKGLATPSSPTSSSVVATASSAMKTLMRRSSRPPPPPTNAHANGNQSREAASSGSIAPSSATSAPTDHREEASEKLVEQESASDTSISASTGCGILHTEADAPQQRAIAPTEKNELLDSGTSISDAANRELGTQSSCEAKTPDAPSAGDAGDLTLLHHAATVDSECGCE